MTQLHAIYDMQGLLLVVEKTKSPRIPLLPTVRNSGFAQQYQHPNTTNM